jgi:protein involved in ribonucleotide reduction
MSKTKKESLKKAATVEMTQEQQRERVQQIINEAHFRFKCCEIASKFAETQGEMFTLANDVYNYSFHIPKTEEDGR